MPKEAGHKRDFYVGSCSLSTSCVLHNLHKSLAARINFNLLSVCERLVPGDICYLDLHLWPDRQIGVYSAQSRSLS